MLGGLAAFDWKIQRTAEINDVHKGIITSCGYKSDHNCAVRIVVVSLKWKFYDAAERNNSVINMKISKESIPSQMPRTDRALSACSSSIHLHRTHILWINGMRAIKVTELCRIGWLQNNQQWTEHSAPLMTAPIRQLPRRLSRFALFTMCIFPIYWLACIFAKCDLNFGNIWTDPERLGFA